MATLVTVLALVTGASARSCPGLANSSFAELANGMIPGVLATTGMIPGVFPVG